jgi:hypothetical protein
MLVAICAEARTESCRHNSPDGGTYVSKVSTLPILPIGTDVAEDTTARDSRLRKQARDDRNRPDVVGAFAVVSAW